MYPPLGNHDHVYSWGLGSIIHFVASKRVASAPVAGLSVPVFLRFLVSVPGYVC